MTHVYCAPFESVTSAASGDLWQIATTATTRIEIVSWEITSSSIAAENLEIKLCRAATAGSGGTAADENAVDPRSPAATAIVLVENSTPAATLTDLEYYSYEQLGPLGQKYMDDERWIVDVSTTLVCINTTTPTSFELSGYVKWKEL